MQHDSGNVVRPGASHAVGVNTIVLQLQLWEVTEETRCLMQWPQTQQCALCALLSMSHTWNVNAA